jgi:ketosteroid isomerase-like protein/predicted enzyme related to lactoylglutathione lyase
MQTIDRILIAYVFLWMASCSAEPAGDAAVPRSNASNHADAAEESLPPLAVQLESKYVTDPALWGNLVFDRSALRQRAGSSTAFEALADVIESFHASWLDRDSEALADLLNDDTLRIRQGRAAVGKSAVMSMIDGESRGERPEGHKGSMQLTVRDLELRVAANVAAALYRVDIRGGARWEYADLATILQVFHQTDDRWMVVAHVETLSLGDSSAPVLPDNVPNRVSPIHFDFVYPAENLDRAIDFYAPLIGEPVAKTADRASFRVGQSLFELTTAPVDDRIVIKQGQANGYGIVNVDSLDQVARRLAAAGTSGFRRTPCHRGECIVSEDPSGNILVWRETRTGSSPRDAKAAVSIAGRAPENELETRLLSLMAAWMSADEDAVTQHLARDAIWVDDQHDVAVGDAAIASALRARWASLGANKSGIDGDLRLANIRQRAFGDRSLVTFEAAIDLRDRPIESFSSRVLQVWLSDESGHVLEQSFITRAREASDLPVGGMDYTAYPVTTLGVDGRYYKTLFGSEPYRDNNWFGFWSTTSVFGLVGNYPDVESYSPVPHSSNGYADLSMRSAEEVHAYLVSRGASFPIVAAINDRAGIDDQPGYRQILAVDSEGNLINFSQYLEY